jgi:hypothetical protein
MAEIRYIKTSIWKDEWFVALRGDEQRLFLYLLTNQQTNVVGIYAITLREMAFDTGIDQEEIKRIFRDRLSKDGRAYLELGWVVMKNWVKNQKFNPNMLKNAEKCFNEAPKALRKRILNPSDTLYIDFNSVFKRTKGFKTLRNIELELEVEVEGEGGKGRPPGKAGSGGSSGSASAASPLFDVNEFKFDGDDK